MVEPTALEQLMLELVNRARADPAAELARFNARNDPATSGWADLGSLDDGLAPGTIGAGPKQPLALVPTLRDAALGHSRAMIDLDFFDHTAPDGRTPSQRGLDAGWSSGAAAWTFGENIAFAGHVLAGYAEAESTLVLHHEGLFYSPGHRQNLMSDRFSEIGIGQAAGVYTDENGATWTSSSMLTQKFADAGRSFLTGVVIDDRDADGFYDVGEGRGGVAITAVGANGTHSTATWSAGGYTLELAPGSYTVTFSGGGLVAPVSRAVAIAGDNVKLDIETGDAAAGGASGAVHVLDGSTRSVQGGAGLDALVVGAPRETVALSGSGPELAITVDAGPQVSLASIERILFTGGALAFDFDGSAGQAYRLYEAAFDRAPDAAGLGYWIGRMDGGLGVLAVAAGFVASAEFTARYGTVDDLGFATLLYRNVLDRDPDASGLAFWETALAAGQSREGVLHAFSDSAENRASTQDAIGDGIWYV